MRLQNPKSKWWILILVIFLMTGVQLSSAFAELNTTSRYAIADVVDVVSLAIVNIHVEMEPSGRQSRTATGSGFIVSEAGYILTNNHVVQQAKKITVTLADGTTIPDVLFVGGDAKSDIAILKLTENPYLHTLPTVHLGDSNNIRVGEWVIALGSPYAMHLGTQLTVTAGIISAKHRTMEAGGTVYEDFLQTDTAINPGNSGGPLVNLAGEVIGINTAIIPFAQGIGFAIPINRAVAIMESLLTYGRVLRPRLGVDVAAITPTIASEYGLTHTRGALVTSVMRRSPAEIGGMKVGDIIVEINRHSILSPQEVTSMVGQMDVGETVFIIILRDGYRSTITVEIDAQP